MQDPILAWNAVALEANRETHTLFVDTMAKIDEETGPTRSSRALGIIHLAMYDTLAGVTDDPATLPLYLTAPIAPPVAAADKPAVINNAVAAAAFTVLHALYPSQRAVFDSELGNVDKKEAGYVFGKAVADALLAARNNDPSAANPNYGALMDRGRHRVDPDNPGQGFHGADYGKSAGYGITTRFQLDAPPQPGDTKYTKAFQEVRSKGIAPELMGTLPPSIGGRTVDETLIGIFWAYDGMAEVGTPPRLYNQIVRKIAENKLNPATGNLNTPAENARLFAFVNVAMADAGILAWAEKYRYDLWRPVVGIREHDPSMGPDPRPANNDIDNNCDPAWLPLGAPRSNRVGKNPTPNFPAYPSGHATFGAAAFHITRLFYGVPAGDRNPDDLTDGLGFVSDEFNGVTTDNKLTIRPRHNRDFPGGLMEMIEENGRSRVYLGVHWLFDAFAVHGKNKPVWDADKQGRRIGGVPLGLQIAEDIFKAGRGLAPVKSPVGPLP